MWHGGSSCSLWRGSGVRWASEGKGGDTLRSVYIFQVSGIQVMGREAPSRGVQVFSGSKRQLARLGMDIELARSIGQRSIDYPRRPAVSSQLPVLHPVWLTVTSGCDLVKLVPFVVGRHLESAPSTALCHSSDSPPRSPPLMLPLTQSRACSAG